MRLSKPWSDETSKILRESFSKDMQIFAVEGIELSEIEVSPNLRM